MTRFANLVNTGHYRLIAYVGRPWRLHFGRTRRQAWIQVGPVGFWAWWGTV